MKAFIPFAAAMLALSACDAGAPVPGAPVPAATPAAAAPAAELAASAPLCAESVRKEVSLTAPDAKDIFEVHALGAKCEEAVLLTTIRTAGGTMIWSHADVAKDTMAFAGLEAGKPHAQALHELMLQWGEIAEAAPTSDAPEWKDGAARPEVASGLYIGVSLPRDEYERFRTSDTRTLCHAVAMNRTLCVAYKPNGDGTGYATELFDMRS